MQPADLFENTLEWLKQHYSDYRFYAERDIVWTVQTRLNREIEKRGLPYRVFNDYTMEPRVRVDLAILNDDTVDTVVEFKYEPSRARSTTNGGDIVKTKFPVVFWSEVLKDIERVRGFARNGQTKTGYSVLIDEGGYFKRRTLPHGSNWEKWSGDGWMLWYKR